MENVQINSGIRAILMDLDNTLIATRKADKLACNKVTEILWEKYAIPIDIATTICKTYLRQFRKCPENLSMNLNIWRHLLWKQALGEQYNIYAADIYEQWLDLRYDYLKLPPDLLNLLEKLRKYFFLGLITNGTSAAQWEKIQRLNLQNYFDIILVSGDLPWEKPNVKIFEKAYKYLGVLPQQCLMIGDKLETDIMGGINANIGQTIWIPLNSNLLKNHNANTDPNPDFVIDHLTDLMRILPKNPKIPRFRTKSFQYIRNANIPDLDDSNSNSSDGS